MVILLFGLQRIAAITASLQQGLQQAFTTGLADKDAVRLSRCLRTYAAIDRTSAIETLFQTAHVRPALSSVSRAFVYTGVCIVIVLLLKMVLYWNHLWPMLFSFQQKSV